MTTNVVIGIVRVKVFPQKLNILSLGELKVGIRRRRRRLKRYPLQVRHKQDWGRGFILLLPQTAALPGSDAGSDVIKPASSSVIQNRQISCSMWCPMYRARC